MKMNLPSGFQLFLVFLAVIQFIIIIINTNYYTRENKALEKENCKIIEINALVFKRLENLQLKSKQEIEKLRIRSATDSARLSYFHKQNKGLIEKIDQLKDSVNFYKINYKNTEIENLNLKLQFQTIAKESFIKTIQAIDLDERILLLNKLMDDADVEYEKCINDFHSDSEKYIKKCLYCDKRILNEKTWCDHNCQSSYFKEINSK